MFTKEERGTIKYTFAHWCAFQMTALNLGQWKFKYLFHDIEKPFLKLFCKYKTVQKLHRKWNRHHLEYKNGLDNIDWEEFVIDNESCRFTKTASLLSAKQFYEKLINDPNTDYITKGYLISNVPPILKKFNLTE